MNPARTTIVVERDRPPGPFGQAGCDRLACACPGQAVAAILFVLTATALLQADLNMLLQVEFKRGISRHLARDSQGFCYLLLPTPGREEGLGFTLKVSRKPHPESRGDF